MGDGWGVRKRLRRGKEEEKEEEVEEDEEEEVEEEEEDFIGFISCEWWALSIDNLRDEKASN